MKKIIIILITIATSVYAFAQTSEQPPATNSAEEQSATEKTDPVHEFSVYIGGGYSPLMYRISNDHDATRRGGFGGDLVGLGYTYLFPKRIDRNLRWGIHTGVGLGLYRTKATIDKGTVQTGTLDDGHNDAFSAFILHSTVTHYTEKQTALFLQIPLMAQVDIKERFYAKAGFKAGIPLTGRYSAEGTKYNVAEYLGHGDWNDHTTHQGYGTFYKKPKGDIDLKFAAMLALETGMRFWLSDNLKLYAGVYFDYGLNNVYKKEDGQTFAQQDFIGGDQHFHTNSILTQFTKNEKVKPMSVGVTVRLAFGDRRSKSAAAAQAAAEQQEFFDEAARAEEARQRAEEARQRAEEARQRAEEARQRIEAERQREREESGQLSPEVIDVMKIIERPLEPFRTIEETELSVVQKRTLDEKVTLLRQHPDIRIVIYGHTCDLGSFEVNERVGFRRAQSVKEYMISRGLPENRIVSISSKRYTEPLLPNTSEENRMMNRRAEIVVAK
ncbi:MAG: OmpA family protein [Bacteroidales bacterium]|jgi:outer membrane protein OmpA-like peptidoglycan-associated protein|nr:OmpA family protein [Bacteroidales bacterium]